MVTLFLSNVNIIEPDLGENETVEVCFNVEFNLPRRRDAVFNFTFSSSSTAIPGVDFYPQYLEIRVPAYINYNDTRHCFNITIVGDIDEEGDETIVFDVLARAEEDLVVFPPNSSAFVITLVDVLGKFCKGMHNITRVGLKLLYKKVWQRNPCISAALYTVHPAHRYVRVC